MKFFNIVKNENLYMLAPVVGITAHAMMIGHIIDENRKTKIYEKKWQDAGYQKEKIGEINRERMYGGILGGATFSYKDPIYEWRKPSDSDQQTYDNRRRNSPCK